MADELKNTLKTLEPDYQNQPVDSYEVLVAENPSDNNLYNYDFSKHNANISYFPNIENLPLTVALNNLAKKASGKYLIIIPDGARLLSKGIINYCKQAIKISEKSIVAFHGFHLGLFPQQFSLKQNLYSKTDELGFLDSINFPNNPDALFFNACWAGSSKAGSFFQMAESNCLMLPKALWNNIGGYDERLDLPSGGIANLDLYSRVIENIDHKLFFVLGEGSFHQIHGGDTTNSTENKFEKYKKDFTEKTGNNWKFPTRNDYEFLGRLPPQFLRLLKESTSRTIQIRQRQRPPQIQANIQAAMEYDQSIDDVNASFIFVMAMHRSKSSYIAKKINEATSSMIPGTVLGGTSRSNPGGHYEPWEIVVFHNNVLNEMKLSWRSVSNINFDNEASIDWRASQLVKLISWGKLDKSQGQTRPNLLIKDPRTVRLWPIWDRFLEKTNSKSKKILLLDHPQKIAQSLYKRDAMNLELGKILWARYTLDALNALKAEDLIMNMYSTSRKVLESELEQFTGKKVDLHDYLESEPIHAKSDIERIFINYTKTRDIIKLRNELEKELSFLDKYSSLFKDFDFHYSNQFS